MPQVEVTDADRAAAETFGNAWRMNAAGKFGLSNLLASHRIAALEDAAKAVETAPNRRAYCSYYASIILTLKGSPR